MTITLRAEKGTKTINEFFQEKIITRFAESRSHSNGSMVLKDLSSFLNEALKEQVNVKAFFYYQDMVQSSIQPVKNGYAYYNTPVQLKLCTIEIKEGRASIESSPLLDQYFKPQVINIQRSWSHKEIKDSFDITSKLETVLKGWLPLKAYYTSTRSDYS